MFEIKNKEEYKNAQKKVDFLLLRIKDCQSNGFTPHAENLELERITYAMIDYNYTKILNNNE
jgi:hypothetical protein